MRFARVVLLGLLLMLPAVVASAQPIDVPPTWGGDLWSRPRLTGSWFGLRDELGKKGMVFDVDLLLTPQSVMTGAAIPARSSGATPTTRSMWTPASSGYGRAAF
jgi:hypothetical protein